METRRLALRHGEALGCELVAVVRNHHDTMPGAARDRPGWDRVRLRLPDGSEVTTDVWSGGAQDLRKAPARIEIYDDGELVRWREITPCAVPVAPPANDGLVRMTG